MKRVSGYSNKSDLKTSKVGADTVLAGRTFHSRTVLGKKEFDSIWSLIRSWNSLCCPAALEELVCVEVYTIVADLVHHGEPVVFSTLCKGSQFSYLSMLEIHPGVLVEKSLKTRRAARR